eukprot:m.144396 g.144396  ORF g.144396 m.144396 type:complete len:95 (+) comp16195_c0_seq1:2979-3263(+)
MTAVCFLWQPCQQQQATVQLRQRTLPLSLSLSSRSKTLECSFSSSSSKELSSLACVLVIFLCIVALCSTECNFTLFSSVSWSLHFVSSGSCVNN